ncbi:hypothetical protein, partial [Methanoculleus sp. MH98A]|uniref:hypothetical protein n=1 Tax=Methanoculleus sp. MH98A TaxID=1495314 RepID=UPI001E3E5CA8
MIPDSVWFRDSRVFSSSSCPTTAESTNEIRQTTGIIASRKWSINGNGGRKALFTVIRVPLPLLMHYLPLGR